MQQKFYLGLALFSLMCATNALPTPEPAPLPAPMPDTDSDSVFDDGRETNVPETAPAFDEWNV